MTSSPPSVRSRRAFTLLELIVTLVVLGLLAAVAIPTYLRLTSDTELRVAEANHAALARATVAHLRLDNTLDPEEAWDLAAAATISEASVGVFASGTPWSRVSADTPSPDPRTASVAVTDEHLAWAARVGGSGGAGCRIELNGPTYTCWSAPEVRPDALRGRSLPARHPAGAAPSGAAPAGFDPGWGRCRGAPAGVT